MCCSKTHLPLESQSQLRNRGYDMAQNLIHTAACLALLGLAVGCGPGNENLALGSAAGGVVGAGAGAVIGNQAGRAGTGAAIGGASGALIGGSIGAVRDEAEKKTSEEDRFIERQKAEMRKQGQEVEDLRRQKFHDDYFRSRYGSPEPKEIPSGNGSGEY